MFLTSLPDEWDLQTPQAMFQSSWDASFVCTCKTAELGLRMLSENLPIPMEFSASFSRTKSFR